VDDADRVFGKVARALADADPSVLAHLQQARTALFRILDDGADHGRRVSHAAAQVVDVIEMTAVERNRMRGLLDILAQIDAISESSRLGSAAAALGARLLQADRVVLARKDEDDELELLGAFGDPDASVPLAEADWRSAVDAHLQGPLSRRDSESPTTRSDERPRGPVLVASLRGSGLVGAVYADKLHRSGRFNEQDHQLAQLFGDYFAIAYGRLMAVDAERRAFEQLATTLDTIRDGVLAIDDRGVVRSVNSAATRMLRTGAESVVGMHTDRLHDFSPLWELLSSARRVDGSMVRFKHGSFIVTARPVMSRGQERGVVATLVELDRARRIAHRVTAARPRYEFADILGSSEPMMQAIHLARQAANVEASVLITGESGTGKEVFAQAIHTGGRRLTEPFVGVNCAAVPRELLEAELFGYDRGAFTGARSEGNPGKFELAGEGTLLLDEIGDMPTDMQAKLLRVLQERVVVRLGGSAERPVRARVVATTHRDLDALVRAGRFRHDLLYRLKVLHVHLPPLRTRGRDILLLAESFLVRFARLQRKLVTRLSASVEATLNGHPWPGNVRELANVMEREVSLLAVDAPVLANLQAPLARILDDSPAVLAHSQDDGTIVPLAEVERRTFLRALELCDGNVQRASQALGVSKVTFYAKLRAWGLHPRDRHGSG
jgi:transcriptional regulator with PAS, ATPase and Fis domain